MRRGKIVELSAVLRPSAGMTAARLLRAPNVAGDHDVAGGESKLDVRVRCEPIPGMPPDTHLWAIVETYPSGHEQILLGGHKPSSIEAMAAAMPHYERLRKERGAKKS